MPAYTSNDFYRDRRLIAEMIADKLVTMVGLIGGIYLVAWFIKDDLRSEPLCLVLQVARRRNKDFECIAAEVLETAEAMVRDIPSECPVNLREDLIQDLESLRGWCVQ